MRLTGAILALALFPAAALAQPAPGATKQAPAKAAAPQGPKEVYAAMPQADRVALQSDLIWAGEYNGVSNGEFGDRSIAAVKSFQKNIGNKETGILNPQERVSLATTARSTRDRAGWRMVTDQASGVRIGIPTRFVPQSSTIKSGTRWNSKEGQVQIETFRVNEPGTALPALFEQMKKEPSDRKVEYSVLRPDFFVITGMQGVRKFYVRAEIKAGEVRGMTITYDQANDSVMSPVVIAMSSTLVTFPAPVQAQPAALIVPERRKVEYGTGIVVSPDGTILTDRQMTEGCFSIVVPGHGDAERLAEDKDSNLILLRVYGSSKLTPIPLATDPGKAGAATLVGIADPQTQGGNSAVTRITVRINGQTIDPNPPLGFTGAAILDGDRKLAGMATVRPQMVAGPTPAATANLVGVVTGDALRKFLTANKVATSDTAGDPTASIVRVICIRK